MRDPLHGPTLDSIYDALNEFNPIIFAECQNRTFIIGHKGFNIYNACYIAGAGFHELCQNVYYLTCRKRHLNRKEIESIIFATTYNWLTVTEFVDRNFINQEQLPNNRIDEISIERIEEARMNAQLNGAGTIPTPMLDRNNLNQELDNEIENIITTEEQEIVPNRTTTRQNNGFTINYNLLRGNELDNTTN